MLKAYNTFAGESPFDSGCLLVFAETPSKAKTISLNTFFGMDSEYIDMRARRVKKLDHIANEMNGKPWCAETNDELPEGIEFYNEEI